MRALYPARPAGRPPILLLSHPVLLLSVLLLGACTGGGGTVPPPAVGFTPATRPGTTDLIGVDARALQRQFGKPRLDIRDPSARKLQFSNQRCVLDAYLYPPGQNREPVTTYVEARSLTGAAVDSSACAKTLREGK
ncbi:hypothetical protein LWE61_03680 [Sphingobium sufflavum]|uniref:hypothetical protein n=1 Tax=Sphingobium sufflavum TaxID=1129547 RepID=UPI001F204CAF|nr:hypothetical protein [Sphingobium sufflavum]MCE7795654.1 hypothetical protein [Sphingobium sufflavum]